MRAVREDFFGDRTDAVSANTRGKERQKGESELTFGGLEGDNSRVMSLHRGGREKAQRFIAERKRSTWIRNHGHRCFDLSIFF